MKKVEKIGCVNAAFLCTLYKGKKIVGYCIDTPNSIAYGMNKTSANLAISKYEKLTVSQVGENRVKNAGWFKNDKDANFKREM